MQVTRYDDRSDGKVVGLRLRRGIRHKGLTYREFAEQVGVSYHTVHSWVMGMRSPSADNAMRICEVLGWSLDHLFCLDIPHGAHGERRQPQDSGGEAA